MPTSGINWVGEGVAWSRNLPTTSEEPNVTHHQHQPQLSITALCCRLVLRQWSIKRQLELLRFRKSNSNHHNYPNTLLRSSASALDNNSCCTLRRLRILIIIIMKWIIIPHEAGGSSCVRSYGNDRPRQKVEIKISFSLLTFPLFHFRPFPLFISRA